MISTALYLSGPGTLKKTEAGVEFTVAYCRSTSLLYKVFCPLILVYLWSLLGGHFLFCPLLNS